MAPAVDAWRSAGGDSCGMQRLAELVAGCLATSSNSAEFAAACRASLPPVSGLRLHAGMMCSTRYRVQPGTH